MQIISLYEDKFMQYKVFATSTYVKTHSSQIVVSHLIQVIFNDAEEISFSPSSVKMKM